MQQNNYKVIALDMDGTVLMDDKTIGSKTRTAIKEAMQAGKEVVFCTGRSFDEMKEILQEFPKMHYLCGESGALLYDIQNAAVLERKTIPPKAAALIRELTKGRDIMPQIFSRGRSLLNRSQYLRLADYQMGQYQEAFKKTTTPAEDVFETLMSEPLGAEKINLYHTCVQERELTMERVRQLNLPAEYVYSEITSIEFSPAGVNKATGLAMLCERLGITMDEVIMVGDADNDLEALKAAGLAVAMKNANENVKKVSDAEVADNNHDGCAQAIYRFLLKKEENDRI